MRINFGRMRKKMQAMSIIRKKQTRQVDYRYVLESSKTNKRSLYDGETSIDVSTSKAHINIVNLNDSFSPRMRSKQCMVN